MMPYLKNKMKLTATNPETLKSVAGTVAALGMGLLAASCCLGPALFILFGLAFPFLGKISFLSKYHWVFIGLAIIALGYSFYRLYLYKPKIECDCGNSWSRIVTRVFFWIGVAVVGIAGGYPYFLGYFV